MNDTPKTSTVLTEHELVWIDSDTRTTLVSCSELVRSGHDLPYNPVCGRLQVSEREMDEILPFVCARYNGDRK